jgi:ankyrin repeat protein
MAATSNNNPEIASALLKAGADVNARDANGVTPLMFAAIDGNIGIIKVLLEAGANVNAKSNGYMTPLLWAFNYGHLGAMSMLLRAGADPNVEFYGQTLRELAIERDLKEIIAVLDAHAVRK